MGANPTRGGGLEFGTKVEVKLVERGMFEFIKMTEAAGRGDWEGKGGRVRPRYVRTHDQLRVESAPQRPEDLPPNYTM